MSEQCAKMTRHSCGSSPAAPASLPDDGDLLWEVLLRLPPKPSSLPRASAVCKRWRCIATDTKFLRCFYAHHRKPPLLGFFHRRNQEGIVFTPILDAPDHVPPQRFNFGFHGRVGDNHHRSRGELLGCRHGRVLVIDLVRTEVLVCDPITREQHHVSVPPEFRGYHLNGAVLCAAAEQGHVRGGCYSSPFNVVLASICRKSNLLFVCVYSSESGIWGNIISAEAPYAVNCDDSVIKGPSYAAPRVQASVEKGMDGGLASKAMEAARRQGEIG
ncbi:hypothetical protein QYE76_049431 [Lolium multiflorum]|uniref:F-box domain-containing protein n=1 Tax=Lolium multiflorum TaxID=4521 RepID=A0AAD8SN13_LOLMU|nr:hypothetical protein QYE76_049431 [Lolium multiflorum]